MKNEKHEVSDNNSRQFYFQLTGSGGRFEKSYCSDEDLINKKKLTNKDIFMSEELYHKYHTLGDRLRYFDTKLREYIHRLDTSVRTCGIEEKRFFLVEYDDIGAMMIYRREYGVAVVFENSKEPPAHLTYCPESL